MPSKKNRRGFGGHSGREDKALWHKWGAGYAFRRNFMVYTDENGDDVIEVNNGKTLVLDEEEESGSE